MFGWFESGTGRGVDTPERLLFRFRDDTGERRVDPMAAESVMVTEYGPDWADALGRQDEDLEPGLTPEQRAEAVKRVVKDRTALLAAADKAFGLRTWDGASGMLEIQRLVILGGFAQYLADLVAEYGSRT